MDEVYMDVPALRQVANTLSTISDVLIAVDRASESLVYMLKFTGFTGIVGESAAAYYLSVNKPYILHLAEKFNELSVDVLATIEAYERGDAMGATRFH